ncbi:hypothetical protein AB0L63_19150 [Nocardia sp. NPDC051990]
MTVVPAVGAVRELGAIGLRGLLCYMVMLISFVGRDGVVAAAEYRGRQR